MQKAAHKRCITKGNKHKAIRYTGSCPIDTPRALRVATVADPVPGGEGVGGSGKTAPASQTSTYRVLHIHTISFLEVLFGGLAERS